MIIYERIRKAITESNFTKQVAILMTGTILAHAISLTSMPLITRLYTPEQFNVLAIYASCLSLLLTISTLGLHISIPIAKDDSEALSLVLASLLILLLTTAGTLLAVTVLGNAFLAYLNLPEFKPFMLFLIPGVLCGGAYSILQMWCSRTNQFNLISRTRVTRAIACSGTQIVMGLTTCGAFGLILGHIFYHGFGTIRLGNSILKSRLTELSAIRSGDILNAIRQGRGYIMYTTNENLANAAAVHLPMLALSASDGNAQIGHIYLAQTIMLLPMTLLGTSVGQVFLKEASQHKLENRLSQFVTGTLKTLFITGTPTIALLGFCGPIFAPLLLGENWQLTGYCMAWMTPWMICQFVATPLSNVFYIQGCQSLAMTLQFTNLAIRYSSVLAANRFAPTLAMEAYAASGVIVYITTLLFALRVSRSPR
jgi:O-antigen/teichoic acid export membrane protein